MVCSPGRSRNIIGGSTHSPTWAPSPTTAPDGWLPVSILGLRVRRGFGGGSSAPPSSSPSAAKSYSPGDSDDASPATEASLDDPDRAAASASRSLLNVEMLLMPDLAARPSGPPTAARKPPVCRANVLTETRVTSSAPPAKATTRTTAAPAVANNASKGIPTSAPIQPPASSIPSAASLNSVAPRPTWSSPSTANDIIAQPITSWNGLADRPLRSKEMPAATSTTGTA